MTDHEGPVCDFCLAPDPRWVFDGPNPDNEKALAIIDTTTNEREVYTVRDDNAWAACTRCSNLIVRKRVQRLTEAHVEGVLKGMSFGPLDRATYYANRLEFFRETLDGLGPRRTRTEQERRSWGVFHITSADEK
jgi:hypothetical protein